MCHNIQNIHKNQNCLRLCIQLKFVSSFWVSSFQIECSFFLLSSKAIHSPIGFLSIDQDNSFVYDNTIRWKTAKLSKIKANHEQNWFSKKDEFEPKIKDHNSNTFGPEITNHNSRNSSTVRVWVRRWRQLQQFKELYGIQEFVSKISKIKWNIFISLMRVLLHERRNSNRTYHGTTRTKAIIICCFHLRTIFGMCRERERERVWRFTWYFSHPFFTSFFLVNCFFFSCAQTNELAHVFVFDRCFRLSIIHIWAMLWTYKIWLEIAKHITRA